MYRIIKRISFLKVALIMLLFVESGELLSQDKKHILFFGDSITAGYNLDMEDAFPALIQQKIDSLGHQYRVTNAGVSGETSAGGVRRVNWILQQPVDIFFLELGGNDGLRGVDPENTKENLQQIINIVKEKYSGATIVLAGMEAPPNMGEEYTGRFRELFHELADENEVVFMPFVLEGVAGDPDLNMPDGIHPTVEGHQILAENIWEVIRPLL